MKETSSVHLRHYRIVRKDGGGMEVGNSTQEKSYSAEATDVRRLV